MSHLDPADDVLQLVNTLRRSGVRLGERQFAPTEALSVHAILREVALRHATELSRRRTLSHADEHGLDAPQRVTNAGYRWCIAGENIARGQPDATEVVRSWRTSAGHCEVLMNPLYVHTGVALVISDDPTYPTYWVQVFAAPMDTDG